MKLYIEKRTLIGFGIAMFAFIWLGVHSYTNNKRYIQTSKMVAHTNRVLYYSEQLQSLVVELETSQRGFAITGDAIFLKDYQKAIDTISFHLSYLQGIIKDNPSQKKILVELNDKINQKIDFANRAIDARRENFVKAQALNATLSGKRLRDDIRSLIAEFQKNESDQLFNHIVSTDRDMKKFNNSFISLLIVNSIILILLFIGINHTLRARILAEQSVIKASYDIHDIYNNAPCGYCSWDKNGIIVDINNTLLTWLGYEREELQGKNFIDLMPSNCHSTFHYHAEELKKQIPINNLEVALVRKNLNVFPIIMNATAVVDSKQNLIKSRCTIFDNTQQKESQAKIQVLNKELEAFTYSVSHDLRAPLRSINGYTKILQEDYGHVLDDEGKRITSIIMKNALRMGNLIDDLLDFSRIGRKGLSKMLTSMDVLVQTIADEFLEQKKDKEIDVIIHPLIPSVADSEMIQQVWTNLLSNAIKYSSKASNPSIEVGSYDSPSETIYYVKDNGVGFDMNYKHKLFGVFQRLHKAEDFEGTGVGLAITQRIVFRHGGRIWAEAKPNEGATFYFTIPKETNDIINV